jgi:hypothetical protein
MGWGTYRIVGKRVLTASYRVDPLEPRRLSSVIRSREIDLLAAANHFVQLGMRRRC